MVVVDTSVLLAVLFKEPNAEWVMAQFDAHGHNLLMSTVNLAETMIMLRNRHKDSASVEATEHDLLDSELRFIPPTVEHARLAAMARDRFPLNLGDCFAYALSVTQNCPILTLDEDFRRCDRPAIIPSKA